MSPRRKPVRRRRGIVLGSGGVLGASWTIGALAALEQATGWDPREADVVVGTSAGSLIAAFLGNGVGTETLLNHQRGVIGPDDPAIEYDVDSGRPLPQRPKLRLGSSKLLLHSARHPFSVAPLTAVTGLLPRGRESLDHVRALVGAVCAPGEWATHPATWIVATDYDRGRRVVFGREGAPPAALADAVAASCAIPGWYATVEIDGRRYVDGGACSPTSLDVVAPLGLDEVFVLAPMTSSEYDRPRSRVARLERRWRRIQTRVLEREAATVRAAGTTVVVLNPGAEDLEAMGANLMDPRRRVDVLETSLRTSAAELARQLPAFAATG